MFSVLDSTRADMKKKRGRPKKGQFPSTGDPDVEHHDDSSKQGAPSELSSMYNDDEEDEASLAPSLPDVFSWSSQQVADYFKEKGYVEESHSMLENVSIFVSCVEI